MGSVNPDAVTAIRDLGLALQLSGFALAFRGVLRERRHFSLESPLQPVVTFLRDHITPIVRWIRRKPQPPVVKVLKADVGASSDMTGTLSVIPSPESSLEAQVSWLRTEVLEQRNQIGKIRGSIGAEATTRQTGDRETRAALNTVSEGLSTRARSRTHLDFWSVVVLAGGTILATFAGGIASL